MCRTVGSDNVRSLTGGGLMREGGLERNTTARGEFRSASAFIHGTSFRGFSIVSQFPAYCRFRSSRCPILGVPFRSMLVFTASTCSPPACGRLVIRIIAVIFHVWMTPLAFPVRVRAVQSCDTLVLKVFG
jgi:hypothetical protein